MLLMLSTNKKFYKRQHVKLLEIITFANIALLCIALLYFSKSDKGQEIVSHISGSITFGLLIIVLAFHFLTEICFKTNLGRISKRKIIHQFSKRGNEEENLVSNINTPLENDESIVPTHSVVDPPSRRESIPLNEERYRCELKVQSNVDDTSHYQLMQ